MCKWSGPGAMSLMEQKGRWCGSDFTLPAEERGKPEAPSRHSNGNRVANFGLTRLRPGEMPSLENISPLVWRCICAP